MKLTKAQEDFLNICWSMKVRNIVPQAAKLGIPEAYVREYLAQRGLSIDDSGFVFQGKTAKTKATAEGWAGRIVVEFLKLEMMDHLWGQYHCIHSLAPTKAWELRRDQRVTLEQAIMGEAAKLGITEDHPEVRSAKEAYLAALAWTDAQTAREGRIRPRRVPGPCSPPKRAKTPPVRSYEVE
jgi:hypothetical protein